MSAAPGPDDGHPEPALPPALAAYAEYEVVRPLGRGGMGLVYLARNRLMGRLEALKLRADPGPEADFLREIQAVARLAHPNIVTVYSARVVLGAMVLAMEYVDGCDLGRLVGRWGRLPVTSACELIRQAAVGLQHAHDAGVVHRDVKPSNLILSRVGGPAALKVLDFGIALAGDPAAHAVLVGTPAFAAPEQFAVPEVADARSDVYALGGTLYYLLAGHPLFPPGNALELRQRHRDEAPPRLDAVRPGVPAGLADLVARMLAKTPADRPQTASEVARRLAEFTAPGTPVWELLAPDTPVVDVTGPLPAAGCPGGTMSLGPTIPFRPAPPARGLWGRRGLLGGALSAVCVYLGCVSWVRPEPDPAGAGGDQPEAVAPAPEPVRPFDGRTLAGWVVDGGDRGEWKADGGVISTTGLPKGPRTWLLTEREYGDVRVRFEYRLEAGGNSGFAFRAVPGERPVLSPGGRPTPGPYHHQVEISDDTARRWANLPTGQVNGGETLSGPALKPLRRPQPPGEWHQMEVELRGGSVRVRVNGEELLADELEALVRAGSCYPSLSRTRGRIGFQQQEKRAEFRNVTVEELRPVDR
jgi:hypothetical protein